MRGIPLDQEQYVSGIGSYFFDIEDTNPLQVKEMFQLQENTLTEQWEYLISHVKWQPMTDEIQIESYKAAL